MLTHRKHWLNILIFSVLICMLLLIAANKKLSRLGESVAQQEPLFHRTIAAITLDKHYKLTDNDIAIWQGFAAHAISPVQTIPEQRHIAEVLYEGAQAPYTLYVTRPNTQHLILFDPILMLQYQIETSFLVPVE